MIEKERIVCLDIETTGLNKSSDKIIEIGCVDISNGFTDRKIYQQYINPKRHIPSSASKIHGITDELIKDYLTFDKYIKDFLDFIKNSTLVIHNAIFDLGFINEELKNYLQPSLTNKIIDTLLLVKEKFPGQKANLTALMKKFKVNTNRKKHGALVDAEILAQIYLIMTNNQSSLELEQEITKTSLKPCEKILELKYEESLENERFFSK